MSSPPPDPLRLQATLCVAPDHPSLAGHFPGRPVVPGVLLLDAVLEAAEAWTGRPPGALALPQVKFSQPLLPGQVAVLELQRAGPEAATLRFRIVRVADAVLLASGVLEWPA